MKGRNTARSHLAQKDEPGEQGLVKGCVGGRITQKRVKKGTTAKGSVQYEDAGGENGLWGGGCAGCWCACSSRGKKGK